MVSLGKKGRIYGAQIGARAFEVVMEKYVDPMVPLPLGTTGAPHEKLSTWVNIIGGIAAPMIAAKTRVVDEETAMVFGGHLFSNVVDYGLAYAETLTSGAAVGSAVSRSFRPVQVVTPYAVGQGYQPVYNPSAACQASLNRGSMSGIQDVSVKAPFSGGGRYARVGS
jgi:hypothetical protein